MFQGIFNYDNPVWRCVGKLGDLILLNILWIICSIPIFTIGASTTAVYLADVSGDGFGSAFRSALCFPGAYRQLYDAHRLYGGHRRTDPYLAVYVYVCIPFTEPVLQSG